MSEIITISGVSAVGYSRVIEREKLMELESNLKNIGIDMRNEDRSCKSVKFILDSLSTQCLEEEDIIKNLLGTNSNCEHGKYRFNKNRYNSKGLLYKLLNREGK